MTRLKEHSIVYAVGAVGYGMMEVLWRGFTHWSMILTGGLCFLLFYIFQKKYKTLPILFKCLAATMIITSLEFIVGCIVNLRLGWNIWDYSMKPFQFLGQICLQFSIGWFLVGIPMQLLCSGLERKFFVQRNRYQNFSMERKQEKKGEKYTEI